MSKGIVRRAFIILAACLCWQAAFSAVGRTVGEASVGASGAAEYFIPLWIPRGTNSLEPKLALKYSSRGGRSPFGIGWSLSGLSAISRCGTTWEDGPPRSVRNDAFDRFCLDGNKLRLVAGTYGTNGAEYRTEMEAFARVRSYGTAGTGPASFTVEMKNGLIYEYGASTDSRILSVGQPTARLWAVNKIRDRFDNAILFTYTADAANGSYRIDRIQYTQNLTQGVSPRYEIKFSYDTLPIGEVNTAYLANGVVKRITRTSRIDINFDGATVRRYALNYESALSVTSTSRLASIQECAGPTLDCFSPTTFTYQNSTPGWLPEVSTGVTGTVVGTQAMDVNGDGREDLVYTNGGAGQANWMVALATAAGSYSTPIDTGHLNTNFPGAAVIDYNADGLDDLIVQHSGTTWWILLGTPSGLAPPFDTGVTAETTWPPMAADVNGDGLEDLLWLQPGSGTATIMYRRREWTGTFSATATALTTVPVTNGFALLLAPSKRSAHRKLDFDGDGRSDYGVYYYSGSGTTVNYSYLFACSSGGLCGFGQTDTNSGGIGNQQFGDFNGDGLTDVVYERNVAGRVRFSTGTSATAEISLGTPPFSYPTLSVFDWDGDGRDDILCRGSSLESGTWRWRRSTGQAFDAPQDTGIATSDVDFSTDVTDVNGDGLLDLSYWRGGVRYLRLRAGKKADLLLTVTDGFGVTAVFDYAPITQGNYTAEASTYPFKSYMEPLYVVTQLTQSTGVAGPATYSQAYWYYGARADVHGRGFQGFSKRRVIDSRSPLLRYDEFEQTFPLSGLTRRTSIYQANEVTPVSRVENTWQAVTYGSGDTARYLPYLARSDTYQYELGGAFNGQLVRTTREDNLIHGATGTIYDRTVVQTEAAGGNGVQAGATYSSRVYQPTSELYNDWSSWCFGRPQRIEATKWHSQFGGAPATKTATLAWDPSACRVIQEVTEPGDAQQQVTRVQGFDGFGNINSEAVTGIGMPTRTTSISWGTDGQFPQELTNALSQVTQLDWSYTGGVLSARRDPNGEETTWTIDSFGRRIGERRPDGTSTTWVYGTCASAGCLSAENKTVATEALFDANNVQIADSKLYADRFERPIRSLSRTLNGGYSQIDVEYDAVGRVRRRSAPCWSASCAQYWTTFTYDALNRVTTTQRPISAMNASLQTTSVFYEGLSTRSIDALSKQTIHVSNVAGGLARSSDHSGYYQSFDYDGFGNVLRVLDSEGNTLQSYVYNTRGVKTQFSDMDMGIWTYTSNALGEITAQLNAKGQSTSFGYDLLGRLTTRTEPEGTSTFTFGTSAANHNLGRMVSMSSPGYAESYTYDGAGRISQKTITSDATYQVAYTYNAQGALDTLTYPESTAGYRLKLQYEYANGLLKRVKDFNAPSVVFWTANDTDARGAVNDETLGNGLQTLRGIDPVTSMIDSLQTGLTENSNLQNSGFVWDEVGNLRQRTEYNLARTQDFQYDDLHRLIYWTVNSGSPVSVGYNALGNITTRSGIGTYSYHATRKHLLTSAGTNSFSYDNNGNATTRNGSPITWYSYDLPRLISASGGNSSEFFYAPDRARWKQLASYAGTSETTIYIGGLVEKVTRGGVTSWRHYIAGSNGFIAEHIRRSSGSNETVYLLKDHLGSVELVTNAAGGVMARLAYGGQGPRRNGATWGGTPTSAELATITNTTRRGFTGHEMLDNLNLVHMNGRLYDNVVGRFLSADPFVQAPGVTQSFNRYSYALNNPTRYVDPDGYNVDGIGGGLMWDIGWHYWGAGDLFGGLTVDCFSASVRCNVQPCRVECGQTPGFDPEIRNDTPRTVTPPPSTVPTPTTPPPRQEPVPIPMEPTRPVPQPPRPQPTPPQPSQYPPEAITDGHTPFTRFAEPGSAAANAAYRFYQDPDISMETKETVALIGGGLMLGGAIAYTSPLFAELFALANAGNALADGMPPFLPPYVQGAKTLGVFRSTGRDDVSLASGVAGPAASMPKGSSGFDIVTRTHAEGHAAAIMHQQGIREATLYINNPMICGSCTKLLERMLPPGARLTVITPSGSTTFVGRRP